MEVGEVPEREDRVDRNRGSHRSNENPNPNANVYTPVEDDVGYFLRATASYDDGQGDDKTAEMVSYFAVQPVPYSNKTPVFLDAEGEDLASTERSVAEDAAPGDPVGDPVQATDAAETGPDVLTYTLDDRKHVRNRQRDGSDRSGRREDAGLRPRHKDLHRHGHGHGPVRRGMTPLT